VLGTLREEQHFMCPLLILTAHLSGHVIFEALLRTSMADSNFTSLTTPKSLIKIQNFEIKKVAPTELCGKVFK